MYHLREVYYNGSLKEWNKIEISLMMYAKYLYVLDKIENMLMGNYHNVYNRRNIMKKYQEPIVEIIVCDDKDIITSSTEGYVGFWGENNEE